MASAQVVETSVANDSPSQDSSHPDHVETSRWSEKEIEIALQGLKDCGRDWEAIARRVITKTGAQCKNFYFNYKKKLQLELLVAEHESTKRSQQQKQQQQVPTLSEQPLAPHKDISSVADKHESDGHSRNRSVQPSVKAMNPSVGSLSTISVKESTSATFTVSIPLRPPGSFPTPAISACPVVVPSHSPRIPQINSSSTLFMPTPGVIASIGRSSPIVEIQQPEGMYFRASFPESMRQDTLRSSRPSHPDTIFPALVYPRAVDPSNPNSEFLVSSHAGNIIVESHSLNQELPVQKPHESSTSQRPPPSTMQSSQGSVNSGSSLCITSAHVLMSHPVSSLTTSHHHGSLDEVTHPGISHTGKADSRESSEPQFYPVEASHVPSNSIVLTATTPSPTSLTQRSRHVTRSPGIVTLQDRSNSQGSFLKETSGAHRASPRAMDPSVYCSESSGKSMKMDEVRRDIQPEMFHKPPLSEPDVIVIDSDERKRDVFPHLETAEGKQASSMLRRLASAGNTPYAEQLIPSTAAPARPQSLPSPSGTHLTETRKIQSATPPGISFHARQSTLNPPPPLIQMCSSRDKKVCASPELTKENSHSKEDFLHNKPHQERYIGAGHEISSIKESPQLLHTLAHQETVTERGTPIIETVDLTKDREVSALSGARPTSKSPVVTLSSSARDRLQAMAMNAMVENNALNLPEKMLQKKSEETHLLPRTPDPKLSVYEQSEAIRKFTALGNVCVSAPRAFPSGVEYPSHSYPLIAMPTQRQLPVQPHSMGKSSPPPFPCSFHLGHPLASSHRYPEHHFLVPVGVPQVLPHSLNGEEISNQITLSGPFTRQHPHTASYFSPGVRSLVPTYQPMAVCGHRYPLPVNQERHSLYNPLDVSVRRTNDISEQDLANPFVLKQARHLQVSRVTERAESPNELPKFPLASHSPPESLTQPLGVSAETKSHVHVHADKTKARSPPTETYLSQIPTRPVSVSEMKNRAALIPEKHDSGTVPQTFPDPQPVVVHSSHQHSCPNSEKSKDDNGCSFGALETLVDVALAARKVDIPPHTSDSENQVPLEDKTDESTELDEVYVGSNVKFTMAATISSSRTSPGISNYPRYGITTGLVPKPPPLMPITGIRPIQDGRNVSSSLLSVSVAGAGGFPASSSPKKFTSPPGTARVSVSPDKPPPLLSRSIISPTASSQAISPKGPPPLIRDLAVTSAVTGPDRDLDSTMRTRINQDIQPRKTLLQGSIVSDEAKGDSDIDEDREKKTSPLPPDLPSSTSKRADRSDTKTPPISGRCEIRSNLETRTYTDSLRAGMSKDHLETIKSSTRAPPLEYSLTLKYSSPPATGNREVSTSTCETQRLKNENLQVFSSSGLQHIGHQSEPLDEIGQRSQEVTRENSSESDIQLTSNRLVSDMEELDKELDIEDEVSSTNLSSTNLPPRIGHLPHPLHSYCGGSDSETLSPDESEVLPESRDEMFLSQSTNSGGGENIEGAANDTGSVADTTGANAVLTIPSKSKHHSETENGDAATDFMQSRRSGLQGPATSTEPMIIHSTGSKRDTLIQNSQDTTAHAQDGGEVLKQEIRNEVCQASNKQIASSRSICFGDAVGQDSSSEAIPALFGRDACDWPAKIRSSEQRQVGKKTPDSVENEQFEPSEQTQDSPGSLPTSTDYTETSPTEVSIDIIKNIAQIETFHLTRETDVEAAFPNDASTWSSTSRAVKDRMASTLLDCGGTNETPPGHCAIHEADLYISSRDSCPPEISSAIDDVSENGENLPCPTFVGEFIPSSRAIDIPNIELGCSTHYPSEDSYVCGDVPTREEVYESSPVLSPEKGVRYSDETLSEGEIPPSKESSQSDDEPLCKDGNEAFGVMINKLAQKQQPACRLEGLQPEIDSYQVNSQSGQMEDDDQLSEGEIPESDDEGDMNTASAHSLTTCLDCSNQDPALETGCYIPISPAPPESPSHESESDRASPLPSWSSADNQYSSVMSLSLAARIPPFPYSTLSLNVGSASSSARSSPVPQAVTVNMGPESSPSSSSLMSRPQEPTPLLSDNYEPLSDDDVNDYDGLGISPIVAHNKDSV